MNACAVEASVELFQENLQYLQLATLHDCPCSSYSHLSRTKGTSISFLFVIGSMVQQANTRDFKSASRRDYYFVCLVLIHFFIHSFICRLFIFLQLHVFTAFTLSKEPIH